MSRCIAVVCLSISLLALEQRVGLAQDWGAEEPQWDQPTATQDEYVDSRGEPWPPDPTPGDCPDLRTFLDTSDPLWVYAEFILCRCDHFGYWHLGRAFVGKGGSQRITGPTGTGPRHASAYACPHGFVEAHGMYCATLQDPDHEQKITEGRASVSGGVDLAEATAGGDGLLVVEVPYQPPGQDWHLFETKSADIPLSVEADVLPGDELGWGYRAYADMEYFGYPSLGPCNSYSEASISTPVPQLEFH